MSSLRVRGSVPAMRNRLIVLSLLLFLFLLLGIPIVDAQTQENEHALGDGYWADLAQDYPPSQVGESASGASEFSGVSPEKSARTEAEEGSWGPLIAWPHIPVSAANLPDGRVLTWASIQRDGFPAGADFTYAGTWDPASYTFQELNHDEHDLFCGHSGMLKDGRVFVNGGRVTPHTSTFDYLTDSWQRIDDMHDGRWYPTTVTLGFAKQ